MLVHRHFKAVNPGCFAAAPSELRQTLGDNGSVLTCIWPFLHSAAGCGQFARACTLVWM